MFDFLEILGYYVFKTRDWNILNLARFEELEIAEWSFISALGFPVLSFLKKCIVFKFKL